MSLEKLTLASFDDGVSSDPCASVDRTSRIAATMQATRPVDRTTWAFILSGREKGGAAKCMVISDGGTWAAASGRRFY